MKTAMISRPCHTYHTYHTYFQNIQARQFQFLTCRERGMGEHKRVLGVVGVGWTQNQLKHNDNNDPHLKPRGVGRTRTNRKVLQGGPYA